MRIIISTKDNYADNYQHNYEHNYYLKLYAELFSTFPRRMWCLCIYPVVDSPVHHHQIELKRAYLLTATKL